MHNGVASRLVPLLSRILGDELPIRVLAWDGSTVGPAGAPAFVIRHRRALRRLLWKPGEMGLVRAYVSGELDIEGDIFAALGAVQQVLGHGDEPIRLSSDDKREIVRTAVMLGAVGPEPKPPPEEFPERPVGHIVAAGPAFFARVLGPSMATTCGSWTASGVSGDLNEAQRAAHDLLARRLGLGPGSRLLDLSCGWGSFVIYAARRYGVRAVGLSSAPEQAEYARDWAVGDGLADRVEIRVGGQHGDGPYDAIVALGGSVRPDPSWYELLTPGGRLIVQQTTRRPGPHDVRRTFTTSYVDPAEGELIPIGELVTRLEETGLEVREVAARREQHARTLRAWADNLQREWTECCALATPGLARVWLLYLAASTLACEGGRMGAHQVYAVRRDEAGRVAGVAAEDAVTEGIG